MPPVESDEDLLTYKEAAAELDLSADYIAHLAARRVLHPVKLPQQRKKYLRRAELEWYARRRAGNTDPNPVVQTPQQIAEIAQEMPIPEPEQLVEQVEQGATEITPGVGIALALLVLALLLALFLHQEPDKEKLDQLKRAPQFEPMRQAIRRLADEIAA
jgi:hypothetical protein